MKEMNKEDNSYKTISEVVKILNLKSKKRDSLPTHTLRFWEKNLNKLNLKYLLEIEDIMTKKTLNY